MLKNLCKNKSSPLVSSSILRPCSYGGFLSRNNNINRNGVSDSINKFLQSPDQMYFSTGSLAYLLEKIRIGIRREDKDCWERRVPLSPEHVKHLIEHEDMEVYVQPSTTRSFKNEEYKEVGAIVQEDISQADTIFALKEVPKHLLIPDKSYIFFSHTIKAQETNMGMLDTILNNNIRLFDYERIVHFEKNSKTGEMENTNRRVVMFGKFAGIAGCIDTLHVLGERLLTQYNYNSPFINLSYSRNYPSLEIAHKALQEIGKFIEVYGLPEDLKPFVITVTGSGSVATGIKEVLNNLPVEYITPEDLPKLHTEVESTSHKIYVCLATAKDMVQHKDPKKREKGFSKGHYYNNPEEYEPIFHRNVMPYTHVLINGMYWDQRYPRLITTEQAKKLIAMEKFPLIVVGDVSCDVGGSVEFNKKTTPLGDPVYVYNIEKDQIYDRTVVGDGVAVLAVDNWPTAFPKTASKFFGNKLLPYVKSIATSNKDEPLKEQERKLPPEIFNAMITWNNQLTPNFEYIFHLRKQNEESKFKQKSGKRVLLLGSGFVSEPIIEYLSRPSSIVSKISIASIDIKKSTSMIEKYIERNPGITFNNLYLDVMDETQTERLESFIEKSDVVLSLVPATMHPEVAKLCIKHQKDMITASYISPEMHELNSEAKRSGVLILNEIGLDPGIDHMCVMKTLEEIEEKGGRLIGFQSYCGALPSPENSNNPLGYKFSWSPKGVITAAQNDARFIEDGKEIHVDGDSLLFWSNSMKDSHLSYPAFSFEMIPNRDSLKYIDYYGIDREDLKKMIRGTLRYPGFCNVFRSFKVLNMLSNDIKIPTVQKISWFQVMKEHVAKISSSINDETQLEQHLIQQLTQSTKNFLSKYKNHPHFPFAKVDDKFIQDHSEKSLHGFKALGLLSKKEVAFDPENTGLQRSTTEVPFVDILCKYLEKKLKYDPNERDFIYMHHEFEVEYPQLQNASETIVSTMCVYGDPHAFSATAKTVGYPVAIACDLLLKGNLERMRRDMDNGGVCQPTHPALYNQVLKELIREGIEINEEITKKQ